MSSFPMREKLWTQRFYFDSGRPMCCWNVSPAFDARKHIVLFFSVCSSARLMNGAMRMLGRGINGKQLNWLSTYID